MVVGTHAPRIKEVKAADTMVKRLKTRSAFRRCGRPAGSGRFPVLSGSQQSEEVGSTRREFLGGRSVGSPDLVEASCVL